jgi:type IV pilus assembly protein PilV
MEKFQHVRKKMDGFSMIEVLIAMLILAFGILSMGGLQLASLKASQMAGNLSTAATLAKEYTELMRSNWSVSSVTSTVAGVNPYLFDSGDSSSFAVSTSNACLTASCNTVTVATLQIYDWQQRVASQLPGGRAVVCRDPTPRSSDGTNRWGCGANNATTVTIKIGWVDKRDKEERGTVTMSAVSPYPQLVMSGLTGYAE